MPDPADQSKEEFHEGTETLQSIADDIEAERERAGRRLDVPDEEDAGETREDHMEVDSDSPLDPRLDEQK